MKRIELRFENASGRIVTLSVDDPIETLEAELVNNVMDEIIAQNVFSSSGGALVAKRSARIVEQQVEEIDLA